MNSYKLLADSYRRIQDDHDAPEVRDDMNASIKALDFLAECDQKTIYKLFDSSAFNDVVKGYVSMIADSLEDLEDDQRHAIKGRICRLLDDRNAEQAAQYYYNLS